VGEWGWLLRQVYKSAWMMADLSPLIPVLMIWAFYDGPQRVVVTIAFAVAALVMVGSRSVSNALSAFSTRRRLRKEFPSEDSEDADKQHRAPKVS